MAVLTLTLTFRGKTLFFASASKAGVSTVVAILRPYLFLIENDDLYKYQRDVTALSVLTSQ